VRIAAETGALGVRHPRQRRIPLWHDRRGAVIVRHGGVAAAQEGGVFDAVAERGMQRSRGAAKVTLSRRNGRVALCDLAQAGSAKAMLPRSDAAWPDVVFLNTSGGLTGGDYLSYSVDAGEDVRVTATTQTAERAYATLGGTAEARVGLTVGARSRLDWLPQETIVYEGASLDRETSADLACGATLLLCEALMFGRAAMGEAVSHARLSDRRIVRRGGRVVWADAVQANGRFFADRDCPALLGSARAIAVVALLADGAEDAVTAVREVLGASRGVDWSASGWDGRCVVRLAAPAFWPLRQVLRRVLEQLGAVPLPRVWQQ
jgi:urease accessory protein